MIQIIGLLMCVYLFVKGLELLARAERYSPPLRGVRLRDLEGEERKQVLYEWRGHGKAQAGGIIAIAASLLFTVMLLASGSAVSSAVSNPY